MRVAKHRAASGAQICGPLEAGDEPGGGGLMVPKGGPEGALEEGSLARPLLGPSAAPC